MKTESLIRVSVRSLYDMQKLRISIGNRIVASFRNKIGIEPSQAEEEVPEGENILKMLRAEYKLITDGVKKITRAYKPQSNLLTSLGEIKLIESYERQMMAEESHIKLIEYELENYRIYKEFLYGVRGVGPMMAGVIISEIDIYECDSISALWAYCGLDVVVSEGENGEQIEEGRCRKAHHLVPKTYTDKEGNQKETRGITFNPFLKTKLVGVLGSVFIKLGGKYRGIYDGYKNRLQNHPKHKDKSKGHIHNMAIRYMIKEFLADLWTAWRTIEGLPVRLRYSEEKLGIIHSKAA
jgi:hypothetical protein